MPLATGRNVLDLHHGLRRLDHADDADGVGAARLLVRGAERLDARDDPLDVLGVVGLGERDRLDVAGAELRSVPSLRDIRAWSPSSLV